MIVARTSSIQVFARTEERGAALLDRLAPGVIVITLRGDVPDDWANEIEDAVSAQLAGGRHAHFFADLEHLDRYGTEVLQRTTAALVRHRQNVASIHAIFRSRIVGVGVSIANVALGGTIVGYRSRRSFESALDAVLLAGSASVPRSRRRVRSRL